jgi:PAS domain S-box-containing protein/diguanylate cyclase (GGDEF)-like protein
MNNYEWGNMSDYTIKSRLVFIVAICFVVVLSARYFVDNILLEILLSVGSVYLIASNITKNIIKPIRLQKNLLKEKINLKIKKLSQKDMLLEQYKNIVDQSSIVSKGDLNGNITYVNDEFCKVSGYTREELIGKPHSLVRHPDMDDEFYTELWKKISNKEIYEGVIKNRAKDGSYYYVHTTIMPLQNENGEVTEYISIRSNITDLIEQEKKIISQTTDSLTDLPNKQKLTEDVESASTGILAILYINKFQEINDYYGYEIGNQVLVEISSRLKQFSNDAKIYKVSGNEFAVFASSYDVTRFNTSIEITIEYFVYNSIKVEDNSFHISIVAGIASGKQNLYLNAAYALEKAITSNQKFIYFDGSVDLQKEFEDNIEWTSKIKKAISEDRIEIFAQPIISNENAEVLKYECLMRMRDDNNDIISPYYFLDIAKKARLYTTLTKILISKSFIYFSDKDVEFSINLTIDDIMNAEIMSYLDEQLMHYDIAKKVVLEIVESEGIEMYNEVSDFIDRMKSHGCKIAIDDFGTGYSNFEYLMKLNVDIIKIDGSMIKNICEDKNSQLVVKLILDFAKEMNIMTVAEYVHNQQVLDKVVQMGVDFSQGYHLGEPIALEDLIVPTKDDRSLIESLKNLENLDDIKIDI